jgi:thymidylate synthase
MKIYHELLQDILQNGESREDRTGVGTISVFGRQMRFNLQDGFPAITTKKLAFNACKAELLWFLEGSNDERRLAEITHGTKDGTTTIWTPNALAPYWKPKAKFDGDLGRVYGVQWRRWQKVELSKRKTINDDFGNSYRGSNNVTVQEIDQVRELIDGIKTNPYGRRHIISAWNVADLTDMALPPCHILQQYYVSKDGRLSCHMYQRSQDVFLGAPFNYASYALLTHMIAHVCDLQVGELVVSTGDTHVYANHVEQVKEQLSREPLPAPKLWLNPEIKDIDKFTMDDIKLIGYESHPPIKAPMAV